MSNLINHAKRELNLIYPHADLGPEDLDFMAQACVLELIEVFAKQGHSGSSAPYVINLFSKLASFKPVTPLEDNDEDWIEVGPNIWQNRRDAAVFKDEDNRPYYINAIVWRDTDGCSYINKESRLYFEFPFVPKTFYVEKNEDGSWNQIQLKEAYDYYNPCPVLEDNGSYILSTQSKRLEQNKSSQCVEITK